jgi:hypothetical protein
VISAPFAFYPNQRAPRECKQRWKRSVLWFRVRAWPAHGGMECRDPRTISYGANEYSFHRHCHCSRGSGFQTGATAAIGGKSVEDNVRGYE